MAKILYNAGFYTQSIKNNMSPHNDIHEDHWAHVAIETMREEGIKTGYARRTFRSQ